MSRRGAAPKRRFVKDSVYGDSIVTRFINGLMWDGKKQVAESIFYDAMKIVEEKTGESSLEVFKRALDNVKPVLEVKTKRIGGANYQVPIEVRPERVISLALKWLIKHARMRKEYGMEKRLAYEVIAAAKSEGGAVGRKEEVHKIAEANRAFAHYK